MSTKRFFVALALTLISFGSAISATTSWTSIFSPTAFEWNAIECAGGGNEIFSNLPTSSSTSYLTRTWTGSNSVAWSATDSRTDQTLNGKAIAMRTGTLTNTSSVSGGIGTLSFNYKRVFTGNSTLKVFVNGTQYGGDITVSADTPTAFSQAINVSGPVTIEIRNSGNRTIIDDLVWNCYDVAPTGPELQLANASGTNVNCDELSIDFGSQATNVSADAVFTIKNTGSSSLTISSLALSNSTDFTIISPISSVTIAPSGSTIVLVRFQSATGGNKTSTLTINNNDANESACVVNLKGKALTACAAPVVVNGGFDFDSLTAYSVDAAVNAGDAQAYIVAISTSNTLGAVPADSTTYNVGNVIGSGTVAYVGSAATISLAGLAPSTEYFVFLFPYNTTDCTGGPVYFTTESISSSFTTNIAVCNGGNETFDNLGTNSSTYTNRTWTGGNGWQWNATDSRNDQTLNGKAITLRNGTLTNVTPVNGGIGTLSFTYKRVFNDNSTLKLFVNGVQYGGNITVSSETPATFTYDIDIDAPVTIELVNSGNRTVIDDLTWNCYSLPDRPEIQLINSDLEEVGCGDFTIDFDTVAINENHEATVTIMNKGLQDLTISALTLSDNVNYTITNVATPITLGHLDTVDVTILLNATTTGQLDATLTIESNDANEGSCIVNLTAVAKETCLAPVTTIAVIDVSNETFSSIDVTVSNVTADGYVAVIVAAGDIANAPETGTSYVIGDTLGQGAVGYVGNNATFTIYNLTPNTEYTVQVYPYNNVDCINGPAYTESAISTEATTPEFSCTGGAETFTNIGTASSTYTTRSWTGDNGINWTATDSRNDQTENGKAIALRTGSVKNTTPILGGVGTITFKYKRVFTGNSTLKVFVNGTQYGTDITVSADTATTFSQAINVSADATIELVNSGNRIIIDDLTWDCYESSGARTALAKNKVNVVEVAQVTLYPNPNNGQFQIDLVTETADVVVYDSLGKVIVSKKVSDNEMIDLTNVSKGIYTVAITSGNDVTTKKVVIK